MVLVASTLAFSGCVTTQQYEALQTQLDEAESENASLRLARQDAQAVSYTHLTLPTTPYV